MHNIYAHPELKTSPSFIIMVTDIQWPRSSEAWPSEPLPLNTELSSTEELNDEQVAEQIFSHLEQHYGQEPLTFTFTVHDDHRNAPPPPASRRSPLRA